jgi:hypothetical protein
MDDSEATSLEQIRAFLAASSDTVRFAGRRREEVYDWTERTLKRHHYGSLSRPEKGFVRRYLARMTGLSRAQIARLIGRYAAHGQVKATRVSAAQVRRPLYQGGCGVASLRRPQPRQSERAGNQTHPPARVQRIRPSGVRTHGPNLGGADLSVPQLGGLPQEQSQLPADQAPRRFPSGNGASRARRAAPDICGSTRCIKATKTASRDCITSMRSTKRRSGRSWRRRRRSRSDG